MKPIFISTQKACPSISQKPSRAWHGFLDFALLAIFATASILPVLGQSNYSTPYTFVTLAGLAGNNNYGNSDGKGNIARFYGPGDVAVDGLGNVYVTDIGNHTIRKITQEGEVTTLADGAQLFHGFNGGVGVDNVGNVYVADGDIGTIWKVAPVGNNWLVTTVAVGLTDITGVAVDNAHNLYVSGFYTIRKLTPEGEVTTIAGLAGASGSNDGVGSDARFGGLSDIAIDSAGNVYVADMANSIRKLTPVGMNWVVTTLAGLAGTVGYTDGTGSAARFNQPEGLCVDNAGNVFVADEDSSTIRKVTQAGEVTTIAGSADSQGSTDGTGGAALFANPLSLGVDGAGNIYVADTYNNTIRKGQSVLSGVGVTITKSPQSITASVFGSAVFNVLAVGTGQLFYQWRFNGQNIPNATSATLTLNLITVANIGSYSVLVTNAYGYANSATAALKLVEVDTSLACYLMTVTPLPDRQSGKNNLVVVTHGAQPLIPDVAWITNLCNVITSQLEISGSSDWQVVPYAWVPEAKLDGYSGLTFDRDVRFIAAPLFEPVLARAENIGTQIGRQIASQGWSHVHLIGHSVGAGLIQAAADAIRANAPNTVIQTTFLDPFLGADHRGLLEYGTNANWSDNYFDHDQLTGSYTEGELVHAYNVDVTWLDPNVQTYYVSQGLPYLGTTTTTPLAYSSHDWPHDFYSNSVAGALPQCAANCGFTLSKESGNWNNLENFPENNTPGEPCGSPTLVQNPIFANVNPQMSFGGLTTALSDFGANLSGNWFTLASSSPSKPQAHSIFNGDNVDNGVHPLGGGDSSTNSTSTPSWIAVGLTITNAVNFIQFDAAFTDSNNAEGLLTVYWDTNQIGIVDERVASPDAQTYRFFLPNTVTNNVYVLGFRLDSFYNTSSSIMVTNVATGFVGTTTPLTLGISLTNTMPLLQLTGASNYNYLVETSSNLVDWVPTALLVNSNGMVLFLDSSETNSGTRFYRASML